MLTTLSLWGIYFASYLVDYLLILVVLIIKQIFQGKGANSLTLVIMVLFVVASILIIIIIWKIDMNTRIKTIPEKNITHEMMGYLLAQVISVATTIFSDWWIPINVFLFIAVGIFFVKSRAVYTSPLFVIPLGNRIYQADKVVIITKYSLQEMKIEQEDNPDGLEARELTNQVFYIRK